MRDRNTPSTESGVTVLCGTGATARDECARAFAERHGLPHVTDRDQARTAIVLVFAEDRLELHDTTDAGDRGYAVEFAALDLRTGSGNLSRKQPLPRAIGRETSTVLDATSGLGFDSVLLAAMGYDVTAVERSPVVAALFEDGLRRALADEAFRAAVEPNLCLRQGDAREVLESGDARSAFDAIYVDPMFPAKRKSALAKRHIRLVREIVGADPDAVELVELARAQAGKRVVVKRPTYAEPLGGPPDMTFDGKLVRYDVYLAARSGALSDAPPGAG